MIGKEKDVRSPFNSYQSSDVLLFLVFLNSQPEQPSGRPFG
jgi:hypothetical protein